mmetsp:Transcript_58946/g.86266  ORF Transcript_58946/g.86266 Transcript_58946/m.86266 type:complete len:97 (+) Transcript_58946:236-526(+)
MQVFAIWLEELYSNEEFSTLVYESAMSLKTRESADSIPLLDEIRFHITDIYSGTDADGNPAEEDDPLYEQIHERHKRFAILDEVVSSLGLRTVKVS